MKTLICSLWMFSVLLVLAACGGGGGGDGSVAPAAPPSNLDTSFGNGGKVVTVFDTSLATIVPLEIVAEIPPSAPIAKSTKQAFALALPEVTSIRSDRPPVAKKPIQRKRTRTPPTKARQIGSYAMGEWHEAVPAGWPY